MHPGIFVCVYDMEKLISQIFSISH